MGVSRTVVNGGLAELAKQGFLEIRPRQGTCVADYRSKGSLETLVAIMEYQGGMPGREETRSILEVRMALEKLVVQQAIRCASDEALDQLEAAVEALSTKQTGASAAQAAFVFQHTLALISGNSIVPLIYYSFKPVVITLWIRFCHLYGVDALFYNVQKLYACIRNRDSAAAEAWIDSYLTEAIEGKQQIYLEP